MLILINLLLQLLAVLSKFSNMWRSIASSYMTIEIILIGLFNDFHGRQVFYEALTCWRLFELF